MVRTCLWGTMGESSALWEWRWMSRPCRVAVRLKNVNLERETSFLLMPGWCDLEVSRCSHEEECEGRLSLSFLVFWSFLF